MSCFVFLSSSLVFYCSLVRARYSLRPVVFVAIFKCSAQRLSSVFRRMSGVET